MCFLEMSTTWAFQSSTLHCKPSPFLPSIFLYASLLLLLLPSVSSDGLYFNFEAPLTKDAQTFLYSIHLQLDENYVIDLGGSINLVVQMPYRRLPWRFNQSQCSETQSYFSPLCPPVHNQCPCTITMVNPVTETCILSQLTTKPLTINWTDSLNPFFTLSLTACVLCSKYTYDTRHNEHPTNPEYYLNLKGIYIGGEPCPIPASIFELDSLGHGGVKLSTVVPRTTLKRQIYLNFLDQFTTATSGIPRAKSMKPFDLCFKTSSTNLGSKSVGLSMPQVDLKLANGGELDYMKQVNNEVACFASMDGENGLDLILHSLFTYFIVLRMDK